MLSVAGLPKRTWEQRPSVVSLLHKTWSETHKDICLATVFLHNRERKRGRKGGEQKSRIKKCVGFYRVMVELKSYSSNVSGLGSNMLLL